MHKEAFNYVSQSVARKSFHRVVEFGARNINGSVRELFPNSKYFGIDIAPGRGVDYVADAVSWRWPGTLPEAPDCIVCCEVLEHTHDVEGIVHSASENLADGGVFIVTCATNPRAPHSAHDGGALHEGDWYENVELEVLEGFCAQFGLIVEDSIIDRERGDLYLMARK